VNEHIFSFNEKQTKSELRELAIENLGIPMVNASRLAVLVEIARRERRNASEVHTV